MSESAWGVDHGLVSKKKSETRYVREQQAAGVFGLNPVTAAVSSKKGRKAANFGRSFGRSAAEGLGGGVAGTALGAGVGAALKRPVKGAAWGQRLGGLGGAVHGSGAAARNAHKRGDVK